VRVLYETNSCSRAPGELRIGTIDRVPGGRFPQDGCTSPAKRSLAWRLQNGPPCRSNSVLIVSITPGCPSAIAAPVPGL
jgi:hypothetical protein